jgi:hypothetical protein
MPRSPEMIHVPVRTPAELTQRWADLLEPPVFGARSLWLAWVAADGLMPPVVVPVDELPVAADPTIVDGLVGLHGVIGEQIGPGGHLAMALCRPGRPRPTDSDERWADLFRSALPPRLDEGWSLHLAAGGEVTPLVDPPWPRVG